MGVVHVAVIGCGRVGPRLSDLGDEVVGLVRMHCTDDEFRVVLLQGS
jgi:hypothetical protein